MVRRPPLKKAITMNKLHDKGIWIHFTLIIILTQQIRQQNNKVFHNLLTRARKKLLNNDNVDTFNDRIANPNSINNIDKNDVIV